LTEEAISPSEARRAYWDAVYAEGVPTEFSWYQEVPESLEIMEATRIKKNARIIDVGGGASTLVDHLLAKGFTDVTVLDVSQKGLDHAKARLGDSADRVNWIVADATQWTPEGEYDLWHDHAMFHFLMDLEEQQAYMDALRAAVPLEGFVVLSGFSLEGPRRSDGLAVVRRNPDRFGIALKDDFVLKFQIDKDHVTPTGTVQNIAYSLFKRTYRLREPATAQ
jgi:2-polyprenyl-3-methyl-5-hydroxy-6-metoxy-1,4-benzoquinol methylase